MTESAKSHACFSHELCDAWEQAASRAAEHGVRVVYLRIGLVIGTEGGLLTRMLTPFEFGLGGPMGSGKQWMSWIERDDLIRLIAHVHAQARNFRGRSTRPRRSLLPTTNSPKNSAGGCSGPRCFAFPPACCIVSAAISPTNFCSAASACCRTRR